MKIWLIAIFTILSGGTIFAQQNQFDDNGKRHGEWKGTYADKKKLRYEGTFNHGKETGVFKFYNDDKTSTLMATRDFSAKDGSSFTIFYDAEGKKTGEGREVNQMREGEWKFYHPGKNTVMSVENYSKGKLNGVRKVYFPDGKIAEETGYVNGIKNGIYKKYTEKGILLEDSNYKDGSFHGPAVYRDAQGNVAVKGQFTKGLKTGIWQYFENGKLVNEDNKSAPRNIKKPKK